MEEKLIRWFGETWVEALGGYLKSPEFLSIGRQITEIRKTAEVFPKGENVFRIFKELPVNQITTILLGLDPFPNSSACGHSFCNCEALKLSPSLKYIIQEINEEYPETIDRFVMPGGGLSTWDLTYLIRQGVFLYNVALTVEKSKPESHLELWKLFTKRVIDELNKQDFLVWLLLGKRAQEFEKDINPKHSIVKAVHPSAQNYNPNTGFIGSGAFRKVNYQLNNNGRKEIIW
jgi:uracil-DNA glycosylase